MQTGGRAPAREKATRQDSEKATAPKMPHTSIVMTVQYANMDLGSSGPRPLPLRDLSRTSSTTRRGCSPPSGGVFSSRLLNGFSFIFSFGLAEK